MVICLAGHRRGVNRSCGFCELLVRAQNSRKCVCVQFLMAAISGMAHKVDLELTERQIRQSLGSKMLHQEYSAR